jgi:hypothetical protein
MYACQSGVLFRGRGSYWAFDARPKLCCTSQKGERIACFGQCLVSSASLARKSSILLHVVSGGHVDFLFGCTTRMLLLAYTVLVRKSEPFKRMDYTPRLPL